MGDAAARPERRREFSADSGAALCCSWTSARPSGFRAFRTSRGRFSFPWMAGRGSLFSPGGGRCAVFTSTVACLRTGRIPNLSGAGS